MEQVQQRSIEWHEQRLGKFTASEIYKLMGTKGLGETGKSYAFDKAVETVFGEVEENFISYDMQNGIDTEPIAFKKFSELKSLQFVEVSDCGFFNIGDHAGASPDGLVGSDGILEIKCPKANTFFKLVATNQIDPKYFYQMQMQMMAANRKVGYFFNYFIFEGHEFWHEIEVLQDEAICDKIWDRILEAEKEKKIFIELLTKNKQF